MHSPSGTIITAVIVAAFCVFQFAPMSIVRLFGTESDLYSIEGCANLIYNVLQ